MLRLLLLTAPVLVQAQPAAPSAASERVAAPLPSPTRSALATRVSQAPVLDGRDDDAAWRSATVVARGASMCVIAPMNTLLVKASFWFNP